MEIKKSPNADLERQRTGRFVIGLLLALASFYVALEWMVTPSNPLDDPELLAQLDSEADLAPLMRDNNELKLAPKVEPEPTLKLEVVEDEQSPMEERTDQQQEQMLESEPVDDLPMPEEEDEEKDDPLEMTIVEDLPQFPGGPVEFVKWLTRNLKYPPTAQQNNVQGKVVAEFIVNKDGSVTDVRIAKSLHPQCDEEALRVLRMMPRWTAGIENDKPCRTKVCIPIVFRL